MSSSASRPGDGDGVAFSRGARRKIPGVTPIAPLIAGFVLLIAPTCARADDTLWTLLKGGGQVVVIRHATAPGTFDPPGTGEMVVLTPKGSDFTIAGRIEPSALTTAP